MCIRDRRVKAKERAADDRPNTEDNGNRRGRRGAQPELFLQEGRIDILSTVREAIKRGHQNDDIDEEPGTGFDRMPDALPDADARLITECLLMLPDGRLMNPRTNED